MVQIGSASTLPIPGKEFRGDFPEALCCGARLSAFGARGSSVLTRGSLSTGTGSFSVMSSHTGSDASQSPAPLDDGVRRARSAFPAITLSAPCSSP